MSNGRRGNRLLSGLAASFGGTAWTALLNLALVPFYVRWMGVEAYGLVGFYLVLQATVQVFELGLGPTVSRGLARYSAGLGTPAEARDFLRTFEILFWSIGTVTGALLAVAAPLIAKHWLSSTSIPLPEVSASIRLMAVLAGLQFPLNLYQNGLLGLQRQVALNGVRAGVSTATAICSLAALRLVSPEPAVLFATQVPLLLVNILLLRPLLWSSLPPSERGPRFSGALVGKSRSFAVGMAGISITGVALQQADKVVLSALLPLEEFGAYAIAVAVAGTLSLAIGPIFNTFFPHFAALAAQDRLDELARLYHAGSQLAAVLLLPFAVTVAVHPDLVLFAWTGRPDLAHSVAPALSLLVMGSAINGLMHMPYSLQLAVGWTRLGLALNVLLLSVAIPAVVLLAPRLGATAGGLTWFASSLAYLVLGLPLTHRRVIPGAARQWLLSDVGRPLAAALVVSVALIPARSFAGQGRLAALVALAVTGSLSLVAAVAVTPGMSARLASITARLGGGPIESVRRPL